MAAILAAVFVAVAPASAGGSSVHQEFLKRLVAAAIEQTHHAVRYDPAYVRIPYPARRTTDLGLLLVLSSDVLATQAARKRRPAAGRMRRVHP